MKALAVLPHLDHAISAGQRVVVRFCRLRGCRRTPDGAPCSRCGTWQRYGERQLSYALQWAYRADPVGAAFDYHCSDVFRKFLDSA